MAVFCGIPGRGPRRRGVTPKGATRSIPVGNAVSGASLILTTSFDAGAGEITKRRFVEGGSTDGGKAVAFSPEGRIGCSISVRELRGGRGVPRLHADAGARRQVREDFGPDVAGGSGRGPRLARPLTLEAPWP